MSDLIQKKVIIQKNGDEIHESREVDWQIDRFLSGIRFDTALAKQFTALSRNDWQLKIKAGEVTLNGSAVKPSRTLQEGDLIHFSYRLRPEPDIDRNIGIVFEDDDLIVVDKPGDVPVHASGGYRQNTLNQLLIEVMTERGITGFVPRPAHRLDRETSGLIIYTKSTAMARKITKMFLSNTIEKHYIVYVFGSFSATAPGKLLASGWIGPDTSSAIERKQRYTTGRQSQQDVYCKTEFTLLDEFQIDHHIISKIGAQLFTGRMHQIRATLLGLGFPLVGDRLYGPDETIYLRRLHDQETDADKKLLLLDRTALHCSRLCFDHPRTGKPLQFESKLPSLLAAFEKGKIKNK